MKARPQSLALEPLEDRTLLATCTVTNLLDVGRGSMSIGSGQVAGDLRFCINQANALPGQDVIDFSATGTINLTRALPDLVSDIDIQGPGAALLTVRRTGSFDTDQSNPKYRIFRVTSGATVDMAGLTVANGFVTKFATLGARGGGIYNSGILTLRDVTVNQNRARDTSFGTNPDAYGGGIYSDGTLTLEASTVSGNVTTADLYGYGAGIYNSGDLTLDDTTVSGNGSSGTESQGVGIYNSANLTLIDATVSGNSAPGGFSLGGGILNRGQLSVYSSTLSGNSATEGSAINNFTTNASMALFNSTVSFNNNTASGIASIYLTAGFHIVSHSTVVNNTGVASSDGSGIAMFFAGALFMRNTIVANNKDFDVSGALASSGHNLIGDSSSGSGFAPTDILDVDPLLGPLQDNGGPTQTMALFPGSPAIDTGDNSDAPEFDQRGPGFPRIVNGTIDIGAFEVQSTGAPSPHGRASVLALATSDALKGRDMTAQGNALGNEAIFASALKGRDHRTAEYGVSIAPLQGLVHRATFQPRALPWADLFRPFGADGELKIFS